MIRHDPRGRIEVVHIYLAEEGEQLFPGTLTKGLQSNDGEQKFEKGLGLRVALGNGSNDEVLGLQGAWDRYDSSEASIRFLYRYDGSGIRLVTIMAPDIAP